MATQRDFKSGVDPTGINQLNSSILLQMINMMLVRDYIGMVYYGPNEPDVANNPRYARFLWIDSDSESLSIYKYVGGVWVNIFTFEDGSIDGSALMDGTVTAVKLSVGTDNALKFLRVNSAGDGWEFVLFTDLLVDGSIDLSKLKVGAKNQVLRMNADASAAEWATNLFAFFDVPASANGKFLKNNNGALQWSDVDVEGGGEIDSLSYAKITVPAGNDGKILEASGNGLALTTPTSFAYRQEFRSVSGSSFIVFTPPTGAGILKITCIGRGGTGGSGSESSVMFGGGGGGVGIKTVILSSGDTFKLYMDSNGSRVQKGGVDIVRGANGGDVNIGSPENAEGGTDNLGDITFNGGNGSNTIQGSEFVGGANGFGVGLDPDSAGPNKPTNDEIPGVGGQSDQDGKTYAGTTGLIRLEWS